MRNFLYALAAVALMVTGFFSVPASAADIGAGPMSCFDARSILGLNGPAPKWVTKKDREQAQTRLTAPECQPKVYTKAPPMPYTRAARPLDAVCNAAAVGDVNSGETVIRPYLIAAGTYTDKHMHDQSTGVDKSDLGFVSPELGGGVCVGIMPRLGAFGEISYSFDTGSVNRTYPTGWTEQDKLSMVIGRIGLMYNVTDRIAIGGYAAVGQGWLKYNQSLNFNGQTFTNNGTSTGTFAGLGAQLEYAFTDNLSVFVRGEKLWMVSSVPVGQNKTDMERVTLGLKGSFDLYNLFGN